MANQEKIPSNSPSSREIPRVSWTSERDSHTRLDSLVGDQRGKVLRQICRQFRLGQSRVKEFHDPDKNTPAAALARTSQRGGIRATVIETDRS